MSLQYFKDEKKNRNALKIQTKCDCEVLDMLVLLKVVFIELYAVNFMLWRSMLVVLNKNSNSD